MTRRDIIIIATLVNAGLLAILFMMAINSDDDKISSEPVEIAQAIADAQPTEVNLEDNATEAISSAKAATVDEVDNALKDFANASPQTDSAADETIIDDEESSPAPSETPVPQQKTLVESSSPPSSKCVEVTVKRGDSLDKIARANGTTISAIKQSNQLKTDRLSIGQVLRIPISSEKKSQSSSSASKAVAASTATTKTKDAQIAQSDAPQYYTVRQNDNPWKIAKQFHLKVDELLLLNNLNEEKARNLKIGDKIRVR